MGRIYTSTRSFSGGNTWTTANLVNGYEVWRTDSGVNTASASVWTGMRNGLVLSQASASLRPALVAGQLSGFGALAWDGVDDQLTLASFVHGAGAFGYLLVFKITAQSAASSHDTIVETGVVGTAPSQSCDTTPRTVLNAGASIIYSGSLTATTTYSAMLSYCNGTSSFVMENGATRASGDASNGATARLNLGNNNAGNHPTTISVVEFSPFGQLTGDEVKRIFDYTTRTFGVGF